MFQVNAILLNRRIYGRGKTYSFCVIRGGLGNSAEGSGVNGADGGGSWVGGEYANVIDITF